MWIQFYALFASRGPSHELIPLPTPSARGVRLSCYVSKENQEALTTNWNLSPYNTRNL